MTLPLVAFRSVCVGLLQNGFCTDDFAFGGLSFGLRWAPVRAQSGLTYTESVGAAQPLFTILIRVGKISRAAASAQKIRLSWSARTGSRTIAQLRGCALHEISEGAPSVPRPPRRDLALLPRTATRPAAFHARGLRGHRRG